jgi:hypothetical protein
MLNHSLYMDLSSMDSKRKTHPAMGVNWAKSHRLPFPTSSKRAEVPLEIVHSDLVGPFQTNSIQGNKYFATFIDDCSKIAVITYMKSKDQFKQAFINYKAWAENNCPTLSNACTWTVAASMSITI